MNINEIKEIEHVIVTEQFNTICMKADEGYVITMWDGEDILTYDAYKHVDLPIKDEYPHIYTIKEDEHNTRIEERDAAIKERDAAYKPVEAMKAESDVEPINIFEDGD